MKRRLSSKPSGEGVPEFGLFAEARERLGISIESAASLIDLTPRGYAFAERWPTCMEVSDAIILAHTLGISMKELCDAIEDYVHELTRLGLYDDPLMVGRKDARAEPMAYVSRGRSLR